MFRLQILIEKVVKIVFTGLIEEKGKLISQRRGSDSALLKIKAGIVMEGLQIGDSIAVNGVCLTVTTFDAGSFTADVMAETLAKTNLNTLTSGSLVNLERALRLGDRFGGHMVSGHIDGVGVIVKVQKQDIAMVYTVSAPLELMRCVIDKGSIAVDGTSLTIVDHTEDTFRVSLIPHTAGCTVLGDKRAGELVNLEGDIIGKYVQRWLSGYAGQDLNYENQDVSANGQEDKNKSYSGLTAELLAENGFL